MTHKPASLLPSSGRQSLVDRADLTQGPSCVADSHRKFTNIRGHCGVPSLGQSPSPRVQQVETGSLEEEEKERGLRARKKYKRGFFLGQVPVNCWVTSSRRQVKVLWGSRKLSG